MPKIKELNNEELEDYLNAYRDKFNQNKEDEKVKAKVLAIETALNNRSLLGITTSPTTRSTKTSFFNWFKRNKD